MKALIAMSGGVDSSVAALLSIKQGLECVGCTMKLYDNDDAAVENTRTCCSLDDIEDARRVSFSLGMPFYVFNFKDEFGKKVIDKFVSCYLDGLTPNPCIDCNRYLKFEKLYERARIMGCRYIVTGHYAVIERDEDKYRLKKAADPSKDQSYVLYSLTQDQLAHTLFPLGGLTKQEVRRIAEEHGFVNARKPDSQDICFVPDGDYAKVISHRTGISPVPGDFIGINGEKMGRHEGVIHYTVGQRRGLGISGPEPYYVCAVNAGDNTVTLGFKKDLFSREAYVRDINWISGTPPGEGYRCKAKIRYRQTEQPVAVYPDADGGARLVFDEPQRAVTPGQAAVIYDGDYVLGGGTIVRAEKGQDL